MVVVLSIYHTFKYIDVSGRLFLTLFPKKLHGKHFVYFVSNLWWCMQCIDTSSAPPLLLLIISSTIVLLNSVRSGMMTLIHIHFLVSTLRVSLSYHQTFCCIVILFCLTDYNATIISVIAQYESLLITFLFYTIIFPVLQ